jgi:hypothetical protein
MAATLRQPANNPTSNPTSNPNRAGQYARPVNHQPVLPILPLLPVLPIVRVVRVLALRSVMGPCTTPLRD